MQCLWTNLLYCNSTSMSIKRAVQEAHHQKVAVVNTWQICQNFKWQQVFINELRLCSSKSQLGKGMVRIMTLWTSSFLALAILIQLRPSCQAGKKNRSSAAWAVVVYDWAIVRDNKSRNQGYKVGYYLTPSSSSIILWSSPCFNG